MISDKVGYNSVEVLLDGGCNGVIRRSELVEETDFTGNVGHMMTVNQITKKTFIAKTK